MDGGYEQEQHDGVVGGGVLLGMLRLCRLRRIQLCEQIEWDQFFVVYREMWGEEEQRCISNDETILLYGMVPQRCRLLDCCAKLARGYPSNSWNRSDIAHMSSDA